MSDFSRILRDRVFSDVVFVFKKENKEVFAHRNIIFARCPRFRDFINEENSYEEVSGETSKKIFKIEIENFKEETFQIFLKYIYTGTLPSFDSHPISTFFDLIRISNFYQVDHCAILCEDSIEQRIGLNVVISIYQQSLDCSLRLQKFCLFLIIKNFSSLRSELQQTINKKNYKMIKEIYKQVI